MIFMVLYLFYHQEVNSRMEKERLAVGIEADSGTPGFGEGNKGNITRWSYGYLCPTESL